MPLTYTDDIVGPARDSNCGVGAFNVVQAALPVILQNSENTVRYHGGLAPIGLASLAVAWAASVPVSVHLDHAETVELVHEAVELGFTSVMFDASRLPYEANVAATRDVTEHCHRADV